LKINIHKLIGEWNQLFMKYRVKQTLS